MTGFPWAAGDDLLAADLNAAFANSSEISGPPGDTTGWPFLPGVVVPAGGSIQAAHDALPATGGMITLSANTTYVLTGTLNITRPNVTIQAPSWNTVIQRGGATGGHLISATSAATGFAIVGVTVDGDGTLNTSGNFEIAVAGADSLVQRCHIINMGGQGAIDLGGLASRADGNRIVGLGSSSAAIGGYGIWALTHVKTLITGNHITGASIDAIGFDGQGTQVMGNYVAGCQCSATSIGGGQICQYNTGESGALIEGNFIDQGGANGVWSYGLELNGINVSVIGNTIINQNYAGIFVDSGTGNGALICGNTVLNAGQLHANATGMSIYGPINNLMIVGNRFADTQATPTQAWGIYIAPATYNRVVIVGNDCSGNTAGGVYTPSLAGGSSNIVRDNLNVADVPGIPAINAVNDAAAATAGIPVGGTYRNGSVLQVRVA